MIILLAIIGLVLFIWLLVAVIIPGAMLLVTIVSGIFKGTSSGWREGAERAKAEAAAKRAAKKKKKEL